MRKLCRSVWVPSKIVIPVVAGSSPVTHPTKPQVRGRGGLLADDVVVDGAELAAVEPVAHCGRHGRPPAEAGPGTRLARRSVETGAGRNDALRAGLGALSRPTQSGAG